MREGLRSSTLAKRTEAKDDSDLSASPVDGKNLGPVPSYAPSGPRNKRRRALTDCSASHESDSRADGSKGHRGTHSVLAWMISSCSVSPGEKVYYHQTAELRLEGKIAEDGICCGCCNRTLSVSEFESHAGGKSDQPYQSLFLEDGHTLLHRQLESCIKQEESGHIGFHELSLDDNDPNDYICALCGKGGKLICCDGCPSTFHQGCLNIKTLPSDDWYCVYCACKFCGMVAGASLEEEGYCGEPRLSLHTCNMCRKKYHQPCIGGVDDQDVRHEDILFCGGSCKEIFEELQMLVGARRDLEDGYTWTLLQHSDIKPNHSELDHIKIECNSKLAVARSVMEECFSSITDKKYGINLIHSILYSCGANINRINYRGFFTIILEKGDEVIAAAFIRIHGKQLAEMPFIGTCLKYRNQGMCGQLLCAIESALGSLAVEKLVIPAARQVLKAWTSKFKFMPVEASTLEELRRVNMVVFPDTELLQRTIRGKQAAGERNLSLSG